eukprot:6132554-Amphidinium_carterae.1
MRNVHACVSPELHSMLSPSARVALGSLFVIAEGVSANINKGGSRRGSQQASVGSQFGGARMAGAEDKLS